MPSSLLDLANAIDKYANRMPGTDHDRTALLRNVTLLKGRLDDPDDGPVGEALSADPGIAIFQLLAATGAPYKEHADGTRTWNAADVMAHASPEQNRLLTLLNFFNGAGQTFTPGADTSLRDRYYVWEDKGLDVTGQPTGHWVFRSEAIATDGPWQTYMRGE